MGKKQKLRRSAALTKHLPLLTEEKSRPAPRMKRDAGEVVGRTAAECAAVCCCPCTVVNFLVLVVYKVPTGLCRKAWNKKKKQIAAKKRGHTLLHQRPTSEYFQSESVAPSILEEVLASEKGNGDEGDSNGVDIEKEMWAKFYGAGFWRSSSQREN